MRFAKVQSIGNDFVLVHLREVDEQHLPELARSVCPRSFSIGADGLLAVEPVSGGLRLRMFNADGSEDFCGNGMRCASVYGRQEGWVEGRFTIYHGGREVAAAIDASGRVSTRLDPASYMPADVPIVTTLPEVFLAPLQVEGQTLEVSAVSTGSTHTVILVNEIPGDDVFFKLGPAIENHPSFPERTSVMWATPIGADALRLRIWERGVGETLGCGTGSAAAAAVWSRATGHRGEVMVHSLGGVLGVEVEPDAITLRGTANVVYHGETVKVATLL